MKKKGMFIATICAAALLSSCGMVQPVTATSHPIGPKTGYAKATTVLGIFHIKGDAGILKACRNGGITEISTVERDYANYFFWQRNICIVNGK